MSRNLLIRLGSTMVTLFGVALIVFILVRVVPGNPIAMMLPPGASDADIALLTALYQVPDIPEKLQKQRIVGAMRRSLEQQFGSD